MKRRFTLKRLFFILAAAVVVLLLLLYVGLPLSSAVVAVAPQIEVDGPAPAGFSDVTLTTDNELALAAWYAPPENGAALVLVHGGGSGRGSMAGPAAMLREAGFGVLAINLRGFGDSEGPTNRLGWEAAPDIAAAIHYLSAQPGVEAIGGLGWSLGGEVLLGAAADVPELTALVTDGATFRSAAEYESLPSNSAWYRSFTQHVFNAFVRLLSGTTPPERPLLESIRVAEGTQSLFIAAGNEETEVAYNTLFQSAAPERSALWVIPGASHTGGFALVPAEYAERVVAFFTEALNVEPAQ